MADSAFRPSSGPSGPSPRVFGLVGALLVALLIMAFVWPAATSQPKNLPVGISGPAERVAALRRGLDAQDPAPFTLVEIDSRDEAVSQIESRELYGAILLDEPEVLVATAASPVSAQALRGVATQLQAQIDATAGRAHRAARAARRRARVRSATRDASAGRRRLPRSPRSR